MGGADLGEGGCNAGRGVVEGRASVPYGNVHEVKAATLSEKGVEEGVVLLGLLCAPVVEAEVLAKKRSRRG